MPGSLLTRLQRELWCLWDERREKGKRWMQVVDGVAYYRVGKSRARKLVRESRIKGAR